MPANKNALAAMRRQKTGEQVASKAGRHMIIEARAGSGKTFTLVEACNRILGKPTRGVKGSPQQEAVWDQLTIGEQPEAMAFMAFNSSIAKELQSRLPKGIAACTLHSHGAQTCRAAFKMRGKYATNQFKVYNLLGDQFGCTYKVLCKEHRDFMCVPDLVSKVKQNLIGWDPVDGFDPLAISDEDFSDLVCQYQIEVTGNVTDAYDMARLILTRCAEKTDQMDFDDMLWLPIVHDLEPRQFDMLMIDESQDLNRMQQEMVYKTGQRLVFCGDPKQAIYGFAGADSRSMARVAEKLGLSSRGLSQQQLTQTRRCGKKIVEFVNRLVPDLEAHSSNPEGEVLQGSWTDFQKKLDSRDMVLCRVNAPLIAAVFRMLNQGRQAYVLGRDVRKGLIKMVDDSKAASMVDFQDWLDAWYSKQCQVYTSRPGGDLAASAALDKKECLETMGENCLSTEELKEKINQVIADDPQSGTCFSSIHKSKGLEASRVTILDPTLLPHPMATGETQMEQEANLEYVAYTRAIDCLQIARR